MHATAKAVLLTGTILGCAIALHQHALSNAARAQSAFSPSAPSPVAAPGDPQRLRDEIKSIEGLLPRFPIAELRFTCWHTTTPDSATARKLWRC